MKKLTILTILFLTAFTVACSQAPQAVTPAAAPLAKATLTREEAVLEGGKADAAPGFSLTHAYYKADAGTGDREIDCYVFERIGGSATEFEIVFPTSMSYVYYRADGIKINEVNRASVYDYDLIMRHPCSILTDLPSRDSEMKPLPANVVDLVEHPSPLTAGEKAEKLATERQYYLNYNNIAEHGLNYSRAFACIKQTLAKDEDISGHVAALNCDLKYPPTAR
jgi:hypothetical protein